MLVELIVVSTVVALVVGVRLWMVVTGYSKTLAAAINNKPLKICVVLGSGGHTSEMLNTIRALPLGTWSRHRVFYLVSSTDKDSVSVARRFEQEVSNLNDARIITIPRAREVGQSYVTSVWTTLRALSVALKCMSVEDPDVILTNGPGVCVPVVAASLLISAWSFSVRPTIAYFESFTCVDHLSLSGRLLLPIADVFTVQWKELAAGLKKRAPGRVWFTGPDMASSSGAVALVSSASTPKVARRSLALVTVGSTQFDELMAQIDDVSFFRALRQLGISECIVQKGRSAYAFTNIISQEEGSIKPSSGASSLASSSSTNVVEVEGVRVQIVEYKPFLSNDVREAALVISHAGAGTILEALAFGTPLIVVPNQRLMSNHQLQLARSLAKERFLFLVMVDSLRTALPNLVLASLVPFPPQNEAAIREIFRRILRKDL